MLKIGCQARTKIQENVRTSHHHFEDFSRTSTLVNNHLGEIPLDDMVVRSKINEAHARKLEWRTTRLDAGQTVHFPELFHDVRVIIQKGIRRAMNSSAVASAVVCMVAFRRDNPVIPLEFFETDKKALLTTMACLHSRHTIKCAPPRAFHRHRFGVHHKERSVWVQHLQINNSVLLSSVLSKFHCKVKKSGAKVKFKKKNAQNVRKIPGW